MLKAWKWRGLRIVVATRPNFASKLELVRLSLSMETPTPEHRLKRWTVCVAPWSITSINTHSTLTPPALPFWLASLRLNGPSLFLFLSFTLTRAPRCSTQDAPTAS